MIRCSQNLAPHAVKDVKKLNIDELYDFLENSFDTPRACRQSGAARSASRAQCELDRRRAGQLVVHEPALRKPRCRWKN